MLQKSSAKKLSFLTSAALVGTALSGATPAAAADIVLTMNTGAQQVLGAGDSLTVNPGVTLNPLGTAVSVNNVVGNFINNQGSITCIKCFGTAAIYLDNGGLTGGITNAGMASITGDTGIRLVNGSSVNGITNDGTIFGISVEGGSSVTGTGITLNAGALNAIPVNSKYSIFMDNLTSNLDINYNGGTIASGIRDNQSANGFSTLNVNVPLAHSPEITVSNLSLAATSKTTLSVDTMPSVSDTLTFGVDSSKNAAFLQVTKGSVNLNGMSVEANVGGMSSLKDGMEVEVATGMAQLTGTTGALGQTLTTIVDNSAMFDFQMADGSQAAITGSMDNTSLFFLISQAATAAQTANGTNNQNVGTVFDTLGGTMDPQLSQILTNINTGNAQQVNDTLDGTLPPVNGGEFGASMNMAEGNFTLAGDRLAGQRNGGTGAASGGVPEGVRFWGQAFGQTADQSTRGGVAGYDSRTLGMAFGADTDNMYDDAVVGLSFSYANSDVDSDNATTTETEVDSYQLTLYGDYDLDDRTYVGAMLGYVFSQNDGTRHNVGGVPGLTARADYDSHQIVARAETGRDYHSPALKGATLTPTLMAQYVFYKADDYTETGAGGANLTVDNDSLHMFEVGVGVDASWQFKQENGGVLEPEVGVGYRYDFIGDNLEATSRFTGGGASFETEGFDPAQSKINFGTGLSYTTPDSWEISARYDYEYKSDYDAHSGYARVAHKF